MNKYQQQEEEICRKRTTADRQKQGKRIFSISTQQQNYNSPSPVAFINKESGFLTFFFLFKRLAIVHSYISQIWARQICEFSKKIHKHNEI